MIGHFFKTKQEKCLYAKQIKNQFMGIHSVKLMSIAPSYATSQLVAINVEPVGSSRNSVQRSCVTRSRKKAYVGKLLSGKRRKRRYNGCGHSSSLRAFDINAFPLGSSENAIANETSRETKNTLVFSPHAINAGANKTKPVCTTLSHIR